LAAVYGRHVLVKVVSVDRNCKLPLETAFTLVNVWSYRVKGKGRVTGFEQSSQLEPGTNVVAGTTVAPVEEVIV